MTQKRRLSATVDADLLAAGKAAVAEGSAANLSVWVNDAMRLKAEHEERLRALGEFVRGYEEEFGEITDKEIEEANKRMRARTIVVRGSPKRSRPRSARHSA